MKRRLSAAVAAGLASLLSFDSFAQATDILEEVVVTAQRREQRLEDVPISVATLSSEKLDIITSSAVDIRFLNARVPSVSVESSFGRTFPRFYIRGLGNTDFDLNASQPVSLVYDDVVLENPITKGFPVFDLERIEVLRGPQGSLFGRNTPAGIIKFDSKKPTQEFDAYGSLSYGRFNTLDFEGAVGGALIDDVLSARLSLMYQERDDYVDNIAPGFEAEDQLEGFEEFAGRLQFLLTPNDKFRGLLNLHWRDLDGTARLFRANAFVPGTNRFAPNFTRYSVSHDAGGRNFQDVESEGASLKMSYDFGSHTLTSITGYESAEILTQGDIDGGFGASFIGFFGPGFIPFPAETADGIPDHDQFTQEFRLESNELGRLDYQIGFFYFDEDLTIDSFNFDTLANGLVNGFAQQRQNNESWAVFASFDYEVSDRFDLIAGLRYTDDEKDFEAQRTLTPFGGANTPLLTANPDDSFVSWDISGTYAATDDVNVYGRIATGFRAPSIQGRVLFGDTISVADSEEILSFEAGVKGRGLDGKARFNFAVFYYDLENQQLTAVGGGANFNQLINADTTNGIGFEFDAEYAATENLYLTVGMSYNDTEIDDPGLSIAPCGGGCTVTDPIDANGLAIIDGNNLPHAPELIFNFTARYGWEIMGGEAFVYTDWAYRDQVQFFLYESAEFTGEDFFEGGVRAGYSWDSGGHDYEVAVFGRNITDERVATGGVDFNNLTGFINEPRMWGLEFTARY